MIFELKAALRESSFIGSIRQMMRENKPLTGRLRLCRDNEQIEPLLSAAPACWKIVEGRFDNTSRLAFGLRTSIGQALLGGQARLLRVGMRALFNSFALASQAPRSKAPLWQGRSIAVFCIGVSKILSNALSGLNTEPSAFLIFKHCFRLHRLASMRARDLDAASPNPF